MAGRPRDEEFQALFGQCEDADEIMLIKNNYSAFDEFSPIDVQGLTGEAWVKLGGYIAGNDYLWRLDLSGNLNLAASAKISRLTAVSGALRNITHFHGRRNEGLDSHCFDLLVEAMEGGAIEELDVGNCNISNLIALARCSLPMLSKLSLDRNGITHIPDEVFTHYTRLDTLDLSYNDIGEGGFQAIANALQREGCGLRHVYIQSTGMGDAGAKILADSLRCNDKLETLDVDGNVIGREGLGAFLRLLNDVSSIRSTESSNHALTSLGRDFFRTPTSTEPGSRAFDRLVSYLRTQAAPRVEPRVMHHITNALETNMEHRGNPPHAVGKAKVLDTQLFRLAREALSHLQGIECPGYHQLFSDLDPVLLPEALALVDARNNNQNELYQAIVAKASDLVSLTDRKAMLSEEKAKNDARIVAITAELARLNVVNSRIEGQLIFMEADERASNLSERKRGSSDISP